MQTVLGIETTISVASGFRTTEEGLCDRPNSSITIGSATIMSKVILELICRAREAREKSYAPYSHFNVGAAILASNTIGEKRIFVGCNRENASYGLTSCGERSATDVAVSAGFRVFHAFAVVGGLDDTKPKRQRSDVQKNFISPCGSCRQVLNEFDAEPTIVILARDTGDVLLMSLSALLPLSFGPRSMGINPTQYDRHPSSFRK